MVELNVLTAGTTTKRITVDSRYGITVNILLIRWELLLYTMLNRVDERVNSGMNRIYFDNNATARLHPDIMEKMLPYLGDHLW
jgi:hypothetical protein